MKVKLTHVNYKKRRGQLVAIEEYSDGSKRTVKLRKLNNGTFDIVDYIMYGDRVKR